MCGQQSLRSDHLHEWQWRAHPVRYGWCW
jgi:hypothetical protein